MIVTVVTQVKTVTVVIVKKVRRVVTVVTVVHVIKTFFKGFFYTSCILTVDSNNGDRRDRIKKGGL